MKRTWNQKEGVTRNARTGTDTERITTQQERGPKGKGRGTYSLPPMVTTMVKYKILTNMANGYGHEYDADGLQIRI